MLISSLVAGITIFCFFPSLLLNTNHSYFGSSVTFSLLMIGSKIGSSEASGLIWIRGSILPSFGCGAGRMRRREQTVAHDQIYSEQYGG
ncbi:hypothetical protein KFK09_011404 [Dendrobium nobile]|uniref:Uncharacterized protein n=1 Tax=Dendrobium nobile TaxID=94219 RepID=A0A8T3BFU7_DENNO|nr:hypothetical protein KFK09_011404 [Dendrobium nobile]